MKNLTKETPYDKPFGNKFERFRLVIDDSVKDKTILDVGCGFGGHSVNFLQRGAAKVVGLDVTDDAAKAFEQINDDRASFVKGSVLELPFDDNTFDTVVSFEVIEHVPRNTEVQMVKEIKRVLKPGGKYYLSTPYNSFICKTLDPAWWLIGHRHYSKQRIQKIFDKAEMKIEKIYTKGGKFTIIYGLNNYISKWIFRRRPFFEDKIKELCTLEYEQDTGYTNIFLSSVKTKNEF